MMIDPDTARNLELVGNMMHKKSSHSLFGYATLQNVHATINTTNSVLNHTYTPMASRLLRVNILSPITGNFSLFLMDLSYGIFIQVQSSIDARLDVVEGVGDIISMFDIH